MEILEAELLVDVDVPGLALDTDGLGLDRVLAVRSELQLDADIAGREERQDKITYWNILEQRNIIGNYNYQYLIISFLCLRYKCISLIYKNICICNIWVGLDFLSK